MWNFVLLGRPTHYFHKLWFQITRIAIVMVAALIPLWLFVPADSKFLVVFRLVAPLLSPAVGVLTMGYYGTAKVRRPPKAKD